jgi:uncharacterized protein YjiS (DUF1127 family)
MPSDQSVHTRPTSEQLARLRDKYQALRALRVTRVEIAPRAEMSALAAAFPGALRELDRVPLPLIEQRLASLQAVVEGREPERTWMTLQIAYHGFMRAVLRLRRALLSVSDHDLSDSHACLQRLAYIPASDEPPLERLDTTALSIIRNPPGGRLNPWVMEQVARDLAVCPADIELALFVDG